MDGSNSDKSFNDEYLHTIQDLNKHYSDAAGWMQTSDARTTLEKSSALIET